MAGGQERVLRRRIRSVQSTKKITKAMELIAASRISRAQQRVAAARPYAEAITEVLANLERSGASSSSPILAGRDDVRVVGYIVVGGDRGLCGGYNANVIRAAEAAIRRTVAEGKGYYLVCVGRKVESYFRFRHYSIAAAIHSAADRPEFDHARAVAGSIMPAYDAGEVDRVQIVYTQFLSAGTQKVVERRFLPLDTETIASDVRPGDVPAADYEYEPSAEFLLDRLLPRYVEAKLFSAMLDGSASFFAAQQRAMASASDNADELITKLTRLRNRARQDAITTEIMEIVSGAEALSQP